MQQGDVLLYEDLDGGEINVEDGLVEMSGGLETAVYLSLFGGNQGDDGTAGNRLNYWGNLGETQPERMYRSETQAALDTSAPIPANLIKIQDAAKRDLAWLVDTGAATSVTVVVSMPGPKKVKLSIAIDGDSSVEYVENWGAQ